MQAVPIVLLNVVSHYITSRSIGPGWLEPPTADGSRTTRGTPWLGPRTSRAFRPAPVPEMRSEVVYSAVVPALAEASNTPPWWWSAAAGAARSAGGARSTSTGLIHHGHGPIALVRADDAQAPDDVAPVLVGIDGSRASVAATALAFDEASRRGVDLIALHAWSDLSYSPYAIADQSLRGAGARDPRRTSRGLARPLPRRHGAPADRHRPARALADRRLTAGPTGGGRQPRPRRLHRDAAGIGPAPPSSTPRTAGHRRAAALMSGHPTVSFGDAGLSRLVDVLIERGYQVIGPTLRGERHHAGHPHLRGRSAPRLGAYTGAGHLGLRPR